jgi:hypothetical protein
LSYLKSDIPEKSEEHFQSFSPGIRAALRCQHHDIDIGGGVEFTPAIAADRYQG